MGKVLLIDDEPDALEVLAWILSDHGCEVRTETQVSRALELGREFEPDLLITDYLLNDEASGLDVIHELRKTNPSLRAVLMTGVPVGDLPPELPSAAPIEVLQKPFVWSDLSRQLGLDVGSGGV
jgi:DNA-binding NtrC family response regulator